MPFNHNFSISSIFTVHLAEFLKHYLVKYLKHVTSASAYTFLLCSQYMMGLQPSQISFLCSVTAHLIKAIKDCSQLEHITNQQY